MATSIPHLDLSLADSPTTRSSLLADLRSALLSTGFLYVSNHGVPTSTIESLVSILPQLFALPSTEKAKVALLNSPHFVGYHAFGHELTAGIRDQKEVFDFATELPESYADNASQPLYTRLYGPNQWPSHPPHLRSVVEAYMAALTTLSTHFLSLIAESLSLPPSIFHAYLSPQHRLKLLHYRNPSSTTSSQGVGPHKDSSGWLTFLLQASPNPTIKGLQALSKSGVWIDVPTLPGTFVVNVGQAFEVVTNGVCKATTHRVLLPPGMGDRYSVPFFQGVRLDLTKRECEELWEYFEDERWQTEESEEGRRIDSAFLRGKYETWGESQLRTKIRSHRDVGGRWYPDVAERYWGDDV